VKAALGWESVSGHGYAVSMSHAAILARALDLRQDKIVIIEDDVTSLSFDRDASPLRIMLQLNTWDIIRFSFRPYFVEKAFAHSNIEGTNFRDTMSSCPEECLCQVDPSNKQAKFCKLRSEGCDLRSSDFYAVRSSAFHDLIRRMLDFENPLRVIDWYILQETGNQWLSLEPFTTQGHLDIPNGLQVAFHNTFVQQCKVLAL